ncbi:MAG TPA: HAD hydrolase-like protein [Clostridiales bacterium]|nr:HAD hydrolase-like protein [Clostridiales bacterium]
MIKAVLFDFDGVLTTEPSGSSATCKYISIRTGIDLEKLESEYRKYNDDLLWGKISHSDIWPTLCDNLEYDISMNVLYESFIYTPIDGQMLKIAYELKQKGHIIGMVTDNKTDRIDSIVEFHNWNDLFDVIAVSANVGSRKTSHGIFFKTLDDLKLAANQCVFIDNHEENLIIPKQLGMATIYFDHAKRDYKELLRQLSGMGCVL